MDRSSKNLFLVTVLASREGVKQSDYVDVISTRSGIVQGLWLKGYLCYH